jgi:pimeloyl-ACP methyl ester carboxylesterase
MARPGHWLRLAAAAFLAATTLAGCMPFIHPVDPPTREQLARASCIPQLARNHVHIFFIHGMDPCDWANLAGVRDYLQSLGYIKTHYGQMYHIWQFEDELRQVHKDDPCARFVLIGFSFGANLARNLAHVANEEQIPIDLLVYLGGNTLKNCPEDKPENALHIVNILATGCIWNGDYLDGADNLSYGDVWHFGSPAHPRTLELLVDELANVAARVPIVVPAMPPAMPGGEVAPSPRPVEPVTPAKRGEWDFLQPVPQDQTLPAPREMKKAED